MIKILITGSSGFVGTNFIRNSPDYSITEIDLINQPVSSINFSGIETVLHLAALVHQMKGAPEEQYFKINRDLAFEVAKRAKIAGVRQFVFMSTAKVFGESSGSKIIWNENCECNPKDPYGKSKFEAERLLLGLLDDNFKIAIIRSPLVYGAGVKANMYKLVKLVNRFPALPFANIDNFRSIVYVGNLISLIKRIIEYESFGIFIAGDREILSTTQIIQLISKVSNKRLLLIKVPRFMITIMSKFYPAIMDRLYNSFILDATSTNERLNFVPPYSTEEGLQEMVKWFKETNNSRIKDSPY